MEETTTKEHIVIVFKEHPILGALLIPYIAEETKNGTLELIEQAFHASQKTLSQLTQVERKAIEIASHYTEPFLTTTFSRREKDTVSSFFRRLAESPALVKRNIRPFIEKRQMEMLHLIRHENLPFYEKQPGSKILQPYHAYQIHPDDVETDYTFSLAQDVFSYEMYCRYRGETLFLDNGKRAHALVSSPSTALLLGMDLYFFPNTNSSLILPLIRRKKVSVPASELNTYFRNIVIPAARSHNVLFHGFDFAQNTLFTQEKAEWIKKTELFCRDEIRMEQSCDSEPDWFDLNITVVIGKYRIPFTNFRQHILEEEREYRLPNGQIVILPEEWFTKYAALMKMGVQNNYILRLQRSHVGVLQAMHEAGVGNGLPLPKPIAHISTPRGLKATLRPYQKKGFAWMAGLNEQGFGGCLADDMGLGKTIQTLTLLQHIYKPTSKNPPRRAATLVVVPTSLMYNWKQEAERFTLLATTDFTNYVVTTQKSLNAYFDRFHLVFTTYGMMRNNIDLLSTYTFEYVVLDESQNIKNSGSLTYHAAMKLQSRHRLILTGTPIENSLKELWAQFHFIQPDLLGSERAFLQHFITPIRQGNLQAEKRLQQLISPFILRRNKLEVAPELPALIEETIYCEMKEEQNSRYMQEKNSLRNLLLHLSEEDVQSKFHVLSGILRLRQYSCHPQLVDAGYTDTSGKTEQIIESFDTLRSEGHKVLIFSSFVKHLELIAEIFRKRGWKYAMLTGSTDKREEEIARFNEEKEVQAFFISLKAGGVGLNLTQAGYVFVIDPWWNPAAEAQAIARAHRIGQKKQVIAYRFITQGSIEEKILRLQEDKRKLVETFVKDSESLPALTNEQWAELLE